MHLNATQRTTRPILPLTALALGLVAVLPTACRRGPDINAAVHSDSSGIEIVESTGRFQPLKWAFDTAFVIGASGDSAFQRVRDHTVRVSPDGHIMILDTDRGRVEIHDSTGALVKRIDAGENSPLSMPSAVAVLGDKFGVYDVDDWSLVRFSTTGEYLGRSRVPRQFREGVLRSDSTALVFEQRVRDPGTESPVMSIVRATDTDTSSIIAAQIADATLVSLPVCGGVQLYLEPLFSGPPAWTAGHGVTAVAETPLYGIRLYHDTTEFRRIRRKLRPEEATNQYAALAAEPGKDIRRPDGTSCTIPAVEVARASGWADVIPAIAAIAIAPDGGLWVQRVDPGHSHPAVDIFNPAGEYVGTLPLETPWPVGFLPNGDPVALADDAAGVTRVIAYHIDRNPKPGATPE
jgi:hypothetical protein